jgi:hypothetical protein
MTETVIETKEALIERLLDSAELDYRCCGHAPAESAG